MAEQLENAEVPWSASVSSDAWAPPSAFDEYRLLSAIARGGMGSVYLAHDTLLDRRVAIKFISGLAPDTAAREQFLIEARAAARLQHPNVLTIHRVGELQGRPYIVAEFLRGMSLDIAEKPMVWSRVIELGIGLSRGLAAAHRRGVLHRDIKPSNAIIGEDGDVKLLDFGLAKLLDAGAQAERLSDIPVKPVSRDAVTIGFAASEGGDAPPDGHAAPPVVAPLAPPLRTRRSSAPPASPMPGIEPERPRSAASANVTVSNSADLVGQGGAGRARSAPMTTHRLMGTPLYMPPEIWRGEAATPRSDIYSLGVVLYELCAGDPPFRSVPLRELPTAVQTLEPLPIADVVPGIDPRFAAIIDRCLLHDPNDRFASGDELRDALEQIALPDTKGRGHLPEGNPYRGLLAFEAEHRRLFFGREREIRAIVERLRSESFVLIASDSGVGKSSLCAAGVLPHIAEGAFGDGRTWIEVRVVPGRRPLTVLVAALAPVLGIEEAELAERLRAEPSALGRDLRMKLGDKGGLLLFVDQLEELIGLSDAAEAAIVGEVLGHLTPRTPGLCLLMAVRSDFLTRVSAIPRLGDELSRALYLLRPLPREGIREAIVGPAREIGVSFESESLVDTLIESTAHAEGGLPLLQFALAELWEAREAATSRITADALEQIGGVAGALARHADGIVEGLPGPPRSAARRILVALVALDGTRVSRTEAELVGEDPAARTALDALLRGRLLVAREGEHGPVYEVAHEALLKGWGTLRRWLEEQADSRAVHHRIASAAQEWARIGRAREALWGARQSAEAVIVDKAELTPLERAFLRASRRAVRNDRIRRWVALASVPTLAGVLYAGMQIQHRREVEQRVQIELQKVDSSLSAVRAKTVEHEALRRRALDAYDGRRRSEGDALWSQVLSSASAIEAAYGGVTFALETALAIDPERERVRQLLADVVYERIRSTEEDNNPALRLELLRRLELYDEGGAHKRLLNMPAHVAVASSPSGARVTLEQFVESDGQKMTLIDKKELGTTPTLELEVAPGSYMLTITASDRPAVRYPILSRRGERFAVNVDLPVSSDVPEGFVYVPAGRFLVGSATDDTLRREFFTTVPLHEVTTPGYIISRYETTYRDWIEFLRALPPDERARRAPAVGTGTLAALLRLQERPDGQFELTIRISAQPLVVREGEMVTYSTRKTRVAHDWRRFPVAGVTLDDAQAYTRWLDETRRVPGARLCTEHEWERAARGADGREYPTGSQLSPDDANFDETYGKDPPSMGPDEVGSHPASESPFGVHDMAGNLFEWASSSIDSASGVIRGGGWYYSRMSSRSVNRTAPEVTMRDPTVGVRVCASRGEK